jgi:hypothetical protein
VAATQTYKHPRSSTAERLQAPAEGRHYSTFSLYTPEELRASIAAFLVRLPSPEVSWVDEHLLVVAGRSRHNQVAVAHEHGGIATEPPVDIEERATPFAGSAGESLAADARSQIVGTLHAGVSRQGFSELECSSTAAGQLPGVTIPYSRILR